MKTGAVLSATHRLAGMARLRATDIDAGATVSDLEPRSDPFETLIKSNDRVK